MNELSLVKKAQFGNVECDFYRQGTEILMTREQIGSGLGYSNPTRAISDIHNRNKERMDMFSVIRKMRTTDGKEYDTYLYNAKSIYEICRYSTQPKAHLFFDFVYDILESIRKGEFKYSNDQLNLLPPQPVIDYLMATFGKHHAANAITKYMVAAMKQKKMSPTTEFRNAEKMQASGDVLKSFFENTIEFTDNEFDHLLFSDLYREYCKFCRITKQDILNKINFSEMITKFFPEIKKFRTSRARGYKTIKVKSNNKDIRNNQKAGAL